MVLNVAMSDIRTVDADAVVVGMYEDVRPLKGGAGALDWVLCGALSRLVLEERIRGRIGEVALLTSSGKIPSPKIFLVGLGSRESVSPDGLRSAARTAAATVAGAGLRHAAFAPFPSGGQLEDEHVRSLRDGLREGVAGKPLELTIVAADAAEQETLARCMA